MRKLIQICGDPTVDWLQIHNKDITVKGGVYFWKKQNHGSKVMLSSKLGGSALVPPLLRAMITDESTQIEGTVIDEELLKQPQDNRITTSWTVWRKFSNPGFDFVSLRIEKWHEFEPGFWDYRSAKLKGYPELLMIQDSGLGFRNCKEGWPEVLTDYSPEHSPQDIIIQLGQYNDDKDNLLLDRIKDLGLEDRTTIITSLSDLRSCAVRIGLSLSWERMLEEVTSAVLSTQCPFVEHKSKTLKYKQVIVTIEVSGAVIVGPDKSTIIFDRNGLEGDFTGRFPGQLMGSHAGLLGALGATWTENSKQMDWLEASTIGIKLARKLHVLGYRLVERQKHNYLQFPSEDLADYFRELRTLSTEKEAGNLLDDIINNLGCFSLDHDTLMNKADGDNWTILENNLLRQGNQIYLKDSQQAVNDCARNIVIKGPLDALPDIPVLTIGAWSSADRKEIEGVRSVNNVMKDYLQLKNPDTPLSVAVFGPPGAGKSFVVKEIAAGLGIEEIAQLTFNLSQFDSPVDLLAAFNKIRDLNLKGKMPLVFWDEFDTPYDGQALGWLRYFLAPMQDGQFTDQGIARPLGGGIYVFAGATRHSFEEFQAGDTLQDRSDKKPDFISRLRAYIDIRGINGNPNTIEDRLYMIRRAFMLRQYLATNAPQIRKNQQFEIETGVLDAFLLVTTYYYGARSMENLVKMSSLADKRKFELSSLPPDNIIGMHTNVKEFKALTRMGHRQILKIGVAADNSLDPGQIPDLEQAIGKAINYIEEKFPDRYFTILSRLASAADRLASRQLLKRKDSRMIAVLSQVQREYINEFYDSDDRVDRGAELRQELQYWLSDRAIEIIEMPVAPTRIAACIRAGRFITDHVDVLIVVWDGNHNGSSLDTADIISRADALRKPLSYIRVHNHQVNRPSKDIDEKHVKIYLKNFPGQIPDKWWET